MSFASVFRTLQELFPQVDRRVLKAVAIEHRKDVNAAVESIISEVLPSICSPPEAPHAHFDNKDNEDHSICSKDSTYTLGDAQTSGHLSSGQIQTEEQIQLPEHQNALEEANGVPLEVRSAASEHGDNSHHSSKDLDGRSYLVEEPEGSSISDSHDGDYLDQRYVNTQNAEMSSPAKHQGNVSGEDHQGILAGASSTIEEIVYFSRAAYDLNEPLYDPERPVCNDSALVSSCSNEMVDVPLNFQLDSSHILEETQKLCEDASDSGTTSSSNNEKSEAKGLIETVSEQIVHDTKLSDFEDESFSTTVATQSGDICRIDVLEDAISDAKNNKKALFSSMESVINMMREVEELEKAAEHAKGVAVKGGLDILSKVEEIKKMLLHAKEANDMHSGEVYGEKAILATEARELQSRLLNLSYERDRSLGILEEMRQSLEARIAVAEEVRKAAEQEKHEKEESARKALVEQEQIMEKVVQENNRLKSEAEENSKLREFLMDRGQIVDILQGEIAVICQDIKILKENFDDRVPFSKSLSSSQTSCLLASSGSSVKSLASDLVPEQVESLDSPKLTSTTPIDDDMSKMSLSEAEGIQGVQKKHMDDDWDMFEDEADIYKLHH
ncbi:ELKS/Rab6-interacting/CAST family protein [Thalictrum thalictroides]|uniref:ELKS/Rab6-interacting/CAST family protein n=1 Tax=Thalictrum thalictroides TaxID=46969 RepID=A0A7J6X670_THATH|nr:ELKS/Rab6-interacting/CAST family protein [Thalictrum thalictroides]